MAKPETQPAAVTAMKVVSLPMLDVCIHPHASHYRAQNRANNGQVGLLCQERIARRAPARQRSPQSHMP